MVRRARVGVRRAAGGPPDGFLRGDEEEVRSRRRACMGTRAAAVQGALNLAAGPCAPSEIYGIDCARLEEDVARSAAHGASLALKTAKKVVYAISLSCAAPHGNTQVCQRARGAGGYA